MAARGMKRTVLFIVLFLCLSFVSQNLLSAVPTPQSYLGFQPGADRMLFEYEALIGYLKKADPLSDRLQMVHIGSSPEGRPMYIAFVSSEKNIQNLENLKTINRELALNPDIPKDVMDTYLEKGRVFLLATMSMHSGEVGPSQATPSIVYDLMTTQHPDTLKWLDDVVLMIVPCHNPDGMNMIVNYYNKTKDSPLEGSSLPGVYHKYIGHDNNRDFVTLSQKDTKAIAKIYNLDWFPHVMVEKHQMMYYGPRYFVPPMHDPIAENVDAEVWNWTWIFGSNMNADMTNAGLQGVSQHNLFDDYWPGSTETCLWKNCIGLLTEAASVKYATPVYVEPTELRAYGKGLSEYKKSINMSDPWKGGWWRLSDIVEYEKVSTYSLMKTSSLHRKKLLAVRNTLCQKEIQKGLTLAPSYYVFPKDQHDASEWTGLIQLLQEHGISVFKLSESVSINKREYAAGDMVVPLAQPTRAFIKEVLETQEFPVRHYTPNGDVIKPYDITSWSLPLHRNVHAVEINQRSEALESALVQVKTPYKIDIKVPENCSGMILTANRNESFKAALSALKDNKVVYRIPEKFSYQGQIIPAGSFYMDELDDIEDVIDELSVEPVFVTTAWNTHKKRILMPRIGLIETWMHDMDAGWTRFVLDQYHVPFEVIRPGEVAKKKLKDFDVILIPDTDKEMLMSGRRKSGDRYQLTSYAPEYTKGMGKDGFDKLLQFMNNGGHIVAWGRSTDLFQGVLEFTVSEKRKEKIRETFQLPYRNIARQLNKQGLSCPGSLVKVQFIDDHPLTYGMPCEQGVFYRGRPVFKTSIPYFDMDRRVIGTFPEKDVLMSGYCEKEELLGNNAAMLWLKKGKGQIIMMAFGPQFRASTQGTYKLLFNALLLDKNSKTQY